jgi:hypothetical protein
MQNQSSKRPKRPRDVNQLAKAIVDLSVGEVQPDPDPDQGKDPAAIVRGRLGGAKGGNARARKLTMARRSEIARKAAIARWKK